LVILGNFFLCALCASARGASHGDLVAALPGCAAAPCARRSQQTVTLAHEPSQGLPVSPQIRKPTKPEFQVLLFMLFALFVVYSSRQQNICVNLYHSVAKNHFFALPRLSPLAFILHPNPEYLEQPAL
jgi:hypothetical protein